MMDWLNIDLNSASERDAKILDEYSFETLLLEVNCNLREITEETVRAQFEETLQSKIDTARDIFEANIKNIAKYANKSREEN